MTSKHEIGVGPGSSQPGQTTRAFLQEIQHACALRSTEVASDVATVVFCTVLRSVSREHSNNFVSVLPPTLRQLLRACTIERRDEPEVVGRAQALQTVADTLHFEPARAEFATRIVLVAAQNWLPRKEVDQLRRQIQDLGDDLWRPPTPT